MIPSNRAHLLVAAATHPGMRGKNNEDQYAVSAYRMEDAQSTPSLLAIISDGIGGHRAGEVASEMAVEALSHVVADSDGTNPRQILANAILQTSQKIFKQAESNPSQRGMGATCVIAWVIANRLYMVSVGDSRLFLLRGDTFTQLTKDHTWIQEAIDYGALTPEQARKHPNAHIIRRYLGSPNPPEPDFRLRLNEHETEAQSLANQGLQLLTGDFLVLCSDGLSDLVTKEEIGNAFKTLPREKALDSLIALANQRGGHDNITVIAIEVPGGMEKTLIINAHPPRKKKRFFLLTALVSVVLIGGAVLGATGLYTWYFNQREVPPPVPATYTVTATSSPTVMPTSTLPPATETQAILTPTQTSIPFTLTPWPINTPQP